MEMNQIIILALIAAAAGALLMVVLPYLTGDIRGEKRKKEMVRGLGAGKIRQNDRGQDQSARRKQIAESLKEIENKNHKKRLTLETKLMQAGLNWTRSKFMMFSIICGVAFMVLTFLVSRELLYAGGGAIIGLFGFPNWYLGFMKKRRINAFVVEFPNAVDVIIRGVKAGLPLGDCLRIIASEATEPVRTEFRQIVEAQSIGLSLGEAVERIVDRVPVAEANFFSIVINIQQKAGGNLSEALGNLSRVLRERKKMKLKIKAMSAEAKASAGIIGALPFLVTGMVYLSAPKYIELLWITSSGRMVMAIAGFWMFIGVMSMKKMVNFDF